MTFSISGFFQDIGNFFKSGSVLGVDIGTVSVKVAEVARQRDTLKLLNYGILETKNYLEHPNQAIQTASLKLVEDDAVRLLRLLVSEVRPRSRVALASIPAFASFVTVLEMPLLSREETERTMAYQARQYIPLPVSEVSIDWVKVDEFESERGGRYQRILLIGIPNEVVRTYRAVFQRAGLKLIELEVESFALNRALPPYEKPTLFIDIGAESTNICVTHRGILKYSGQTDYGGIFLTQALSRSLGITNTRAEELKRRRGLLGTGGELELSTLILSFLDVIIQEVRHVQDLYERRYAEKAAQAVLVGGGANLLGVDAYFKSQLNLPLVRADVLQRLEYSQALTPAEKNLSNVLPVAVGLTKRYFEQ